jgi:hypothetical protein
MSQDTQPDEKSAVRERYAALIPHPTRWAAWLVPSEGGWILPDFIPDHEIHNWDLPPARRAIEQQLQVDARICYALRLFEPAIPGPLNVYVVERIPCGASLLPEGRWIGPDELGALPMAYPRQRAVLQTWLNGEMGEPLATLDIPWWREGWLSEVEAWLSNQADRRGYLPTGPAERLKGTAWSEVVRLPARPADLYLKAMPRPFAHEGSVLTALSEEHPTRVPSLMVSDPERRWLLMRDMGGRSLGSDVPVERWEEAARVYGQLQAAAALDTDQWLVLGCLDLRLDRFGEELETLLAHLPERLRGLNTALSEAELAALRSQVPAYLRAAEELEQCGISMSLEHGDLNVYNIRVVDDGIIFFDWSHACVTHPFFGVHDLIADDDWFPDQPDFRGRVRDAYLEAWTALQPLEELRAAFQLAQPVRGLFRALHQNRVTAAFQEMLGGQEYVVETPTGNWLEYMQWWLAEHLRRLLRERPCEQGTTAANAGVSTAPAR